NPSDLRLLPARKAPSADPAIRVSSNGWYNAPRWPPKPMKLPMTETRTTRYPKTINTRGPLPRMNPESAPHHPLIAPPQKRGSEGIFRGFLGLLELARAIRPARRTTTRRAQPFRGRPRASCRRVEADGRSRTRNPPADHAHGR